jgi:diaminopimelate epimerase
MGFEALGIDRAEVRLKTSSAWAERDADVAPGVYTVRETAGPAGLDVRNWPMTAGVERIVDAPVAPLGSARLFTAVAMPNPHLVTFVETVDEAELVEIGEACEAAPDWLPNRANVSFVEVRGKDLFVRTFERGVGLTDSCGSAMAASAFAACLTGRVGYGAAITVFNKGGLVRATVARDAMVSLSGNATWEYRGSVEVDIAAERAGDLIVHGHADDEIAAWARLVDTASR